MKKNLDSSQEKIYKRCKKHFHLFFIFLIFQISSNSLYGAENQSMRMDSNGNIFVAWQENISSGTIIQTSSKPFSSISWETPVTLSNSDTGSLPVIATAANGLDTYAVAVWTESSGGITHLYGAMRPSLLANWTLSNLISNGVEEVSSNHKLFINSNGQITVTWTSLTFVNWDLRCSTAIINNSNTWDLPTTINP